MISAEIPDRSEDPELHNLVCTLMVHGPCGQDKTKANCLKDKVCMKKFPKPYAI
jgi:hypothetical protein